MESAKDRENVTKTKVITNVTQVINVTNVTSPHVVRWTMEEMTSSALLTRSIA